MKLAIQSLLPEEMGPQFSTMLDLGLAMMSDEQMASLAADLESARAEDGTADLDKLTEIGKKFGVTPDMVAAYGASSSAA